MSKIPRIRLLAQSKVEKRQPMNFLYARAELNPEGLFLDDGLVGVTNKTARDFINKLAGYLKELGVKPGDIVGLNMPPALYVYFLMATWHQRAIATNFTAQIARDAKWKPEWIFSTVDFDSNHGKNVVWISDSTLEYIKSLESHVVTKSYKSINEPIALISSSGTTGVPKAAPLSLGNLEDRTVVYDTPSLGYRGSLALLDIGTSVGLRSFYGELRTNGCYLIPGNMQTNIDIVVKHGTQGVIGSPNQLAAFLDAAQISQSSRVEIKTVIVTGAALSQEKATQIKQFFKCAIVNHYGSQESGLVSARRDESVNPFALGEVANGVRIEIVDDRNKKVSDGTTGKIRAKSKSIVSGYFKDEENTHRFFKKGWFYSGDLGHFDENSHLFLDGRVTEVINAGGVKIDPAKIDEFIVGKLGVIDAGTFGYLESLGTEKIGIAVVAASDFQEVLLLDLLKQYIGTTFPVSVYQVDRIFRNDRGKVSRRDIAASYLQFIGVKN
jgi:long-chain acyl-CoA synthetase